MACYWSTSTNLEFKLAMTLSKMSNLLHILILYYEPIARWILRNVSREDTPAGLRDGPPCTAAPWRRLFLWLLCGWMLEFSFAFHADDTQQELHDISAKISKSLTERHDNLTEVIYTIIPASLSTLSSGENQTAIFLVAQAECLAIFLQLHW